MYVCRHARRVRPLPRIQSLGHTDPGLRPHNRRDSAPADHRGVRGGAAPGRAHPDPSPVLSLHRVGRALRVGGDRHPLLSRPARPDRAARRAHRPGRRVRPGGRPAIPPARDGARGELRLPPLRPGGVGQAVRLHHPAVRGGVPARAVQPALRAPPPGLVRPEAPGRGLVGDVRGVDDAGAGLAQGVQRLAGGGGEAGLLRPDHGGAARSRPGGHQRRARRGRRGHRVLAGPLLSGRGDRPR